MENTTWPDDGPPHAPVARPFAVAALISIGSIAVVVAMSLLRAAMRGAILLPLLAFGSCAFTTRVVSLQHTEAVTKSCSIPQLKGVKVHLAAVVDGRETSWGETPVTVDPPGFTYKAPSGSEEILWEQAVDRSGPRHEVGTVRNLYGMVTARVYSVDPPATWLSDGLRHEFEAHGAILTSEADADLRIRVTLRFLRADLYMAIWSKLVAEVELDQVGKEPRKVLLHARGSDTAGTASSWEYYKVIRSSQQKLLTHILLLAAGGEAPTTERDGKAQAATKKQAESDVEKNPVWSGR